MGVVSVAALVSAFPQPRAAPAEGLGRAFTSRFIYGYRRRENSRRLLISTTVRENPPIQARANKLIPVVVGGPQDLFVPNLIRANVGDVVQFQFSNGNHTVTQSAENAGCQPLQAANPQAIHSGHIPFKDGQKEVGTFNMPVTSTEAMFLYCATGPHCQTGQVMVVNPYGLCPTSRYIMLEEANMAIVRTMSSWSIMPRYQWLQRRTWMALESLVASLAVFPFRLPHLYLRPPRKNRRRQLHHRQTRQRHTKCGNGTY